MCLLIECVCDVIRSYWLALELPRKHYANWDQAKIRIEKMLAAADRLMAHYTARRERNLRLLCHVAASKKLDAMCRALTQRAGGDATVVGFGDYG